LLHCAANMTRSYSTRMRTPGICLVLALVALRYFELSAAENVCKYRNVQEVDTGISFDSVSAERASTSTSTYYKFYLEFPEFDDEDCDGPAKPCCDSLKAVTSISMKLDDSCKSRMSKVEVKVGSSYLPKTAYTIDPAVPAIHMKGLNLTAIRRSYHKIYLKFVGDKQGCGKSSPCPETGCSYNLTTTLTTSPAADECCTVEGDTDIGRGRITISTTTDYKKYPVRFMVLGDWGCAPSSKEDGKQERVALLMSDVAKVLKPQFVANTGDNFYENGLNRRNTGGRWAQSWSKVYMRYSALRNLPWYGVLGNHDYNYRGRLQRYLDTTTGKYSEQLPTNSSGTWVDCYVEDRAACLSPSTPCCTSPLWQYSQYQAGNDNVRARQWILSNGTQSASFKDPASGQTLLDLVMIDTNPFIGSMYRFTSKDTATYPVWLPGNLNDQSPNATRALMRDVLRTSRAPWRVVMGHHGMENYGGHCGRVDGVDGIQIDIMANDCQYIQDLKSDLKELKVPLYLNGHDHNLQVVKNASWPTYMITSGSGCKASSLAWNPVQAASLMWPRGPMSVNDTEKLAGSYGFASVALNKDEMVVEVWRLPSVGYRDTYFKLPVLKAADYKL